MSRYRFGLIPEFDLWVRERRLLADGRPVPLGSRALDVLTVLVERAGQVVSRRELFERVWPHVAVEDNNLNVQISSLRKALGPDLIQTVAGRGYTFTQLPRASVDASAEAPAPRLKTNLPATLTPLIGREDELAGLQQLCEDHRLLTVLGPGGVGKTLLAQHLLRRFEHRFCHGVCFVELATVTDADSLAGAIAACLQIDPAAGATLAGLVHALAPLEMMLALDNAEHLVDGVARLASALHDTAARLRLVVTSQAPLRLAAERQYRIGPLAVPDIDLPAVQAMRCGAIALFVDRAMAVDARFTLSDDTASVAIDLCRSLDGLPLAIELAASRAPTLGVRRLAESMSDPLRLLGAAALGAPRRLQSLRSALTWSHELLDRSAQTVFRRLAVLVGSSDLHMVLAVADDTADPPDRVDVGNLCSEGTLAALFTLVERSLVNAVPDHHGRVRYRLLEAPRAFALEQLVAAGEERLVRDRHARAAAQWFRRAFDQRFTGQEAIRAWEERLAADVDNGHAALAWLSAQQPPRRDDMLTLLPGLMLATPQMEVDRQRAMQTLAMALTEPDAEPSLEGSWALTEAAIAPVQPGPAPNSPMALRAVSLARTLQPTCADARWLYRALCHATVALLSNAQLDDGRALLEQARVLEDVTWPAVFLQRRWLAEVWLADRLADGDTMYRASLRYHALSTAAGMPGPMSAQTVVNSALAGGHPEEALRHGLAVIDHLSGSRHLAEVAKIRTMVMAAHIACDQLAEARAASLAVWPIALDLGRPYEWADYQALLAALEGRPDDAARLQGFAEQLYARRGLVRTFNEARAWARTRQLLAARLAPEALERLLAEGASLQAAEVAAIAFGDQGLDEPA